MFSWVVIGFLICHPCYKLDSNYAFVEQRFQLQGDCDKLADAKNTAAIIQKENKRYVCTYVGEK